jgi:hypothetical protein
VQTDNVRFEKRWSAPGVVSEAWATLGDLRVRLGVDGDGHDIFIEVALRNDRGVTQARWDEVNLAETMVRIEEANRSIQDKIAGRSAKRTHRKHLLIPKSRPYPESFFESVASLYLMLVNEGVQNPAVAVAEANKVRVTSVRGWIRQARLRGYLDPGEKGKVG